MSFFPSESVFVDDNEKNVRAAAVAGMQEYLFTDQDRFEDWAKENL
jgi:FMN phosphatase YigB (HAD superfamily)